MGVERKILDVGLVELSIGKYALVIMMLTKKDNFGNSTECCMCGIII
jgi:hypothetical protein